MEEFINSFFGTNILYIIFVVLISISIFNTRKEKYNDDLKEKINFNIEWSFLIRMICITLFLTILLGQITTYLPISKTTVNTNDILSNLFLYFISTIIVAPICEEIVFRFGLYEYLNKKVNLIVAILITSVLFSLIHGYKFDGFIILLILSIIWNYSYLKTNNIVYPIILHLCNNLYSFMGNFYNSNTIDILFGVVCLIIYLLLHLKNSSKKLLSARKKNE